MVIALLILFGLCLGSFVNALVWRLHEQSLAKSKKPKAQPSPSLSIVNGRSMCVHCKHVLAMKDLIPAISWLSLRGKCRYCQKPISWQYPLVEAVTAALFVTSYLFWPEALTGVQIFQFVLWLIFLVGFVALAVYDLRWFELPDKIVYPLMGLALIQVFVLSVNSQSIQPLVGAFWGVLIGGGLFYGLFQLSAGKWIGGGDVKLGALLGLIVGGPMQSILLLFVASSSGTLLSIPLLLSGKAKRTTKLPFGPFLLVAAVIVRLFGERLINWYNTAIIGF